MGFDCESACSFDQNRPGIVNVTSSTKYDLIYQFSNIHPGDQLPQLKAILRNT